MMHHISAEPPPFFHRGPSPLARLAFFGLLSLALMFADTRFRYLEGIRQVASVALYPLQRAVQMPGEALAWVGAYFASKRALTDENAALKQDLVAHSLSVQEFARLQTENASLRGLLDLTRRYSGTAIAVEVLYTGRDPFTQKLFVNRGSEAGIARRPGGGRRPGRHRAGDARVPGHGGSHADDRQGPRGAGEGRAQRRAQRGVRRGCGPFARAALHGADRRHPAGRQARHLRPRRHLSRRARGRAGRIGRARDAGRCSRRSSCARSPVPTAARYLLVLGQSSALPPRPEEPPEADTAKKGRGKGRRG